MQLVLPLLQSSSGGSSGGVDYNTAIDSSYDIYNINIGLFNVPNAFVDGADTSHGKRGVLGVGSRHSQNSGRNSQYEVYVAAGASALSVKALTYDFNRSIKSIDSGNVRAGIYYDPNSGASWMPNYGDNTVSNVRPHTKIIAGVKQKGYIVMSGGNKFLVVTTGASVVSYPVNINNVVSGPLISNVANPSGGQLFAVGMNGNHVFCVSKTLTTSPDFRYNVNGHICQISSTGVITIVNTLNIYNPTSAAAGYSGDYVTSYIYSYQRNLSGYIYIDYTAGGNAGLSSARTRRDLFSIDLTNTTTFSFTNIRNEVPGQKGLPGSNIKEGIGGRDNATTSFYFVQPHNVFFDGFSYVYADSTVIWRVQSSGITNTGLNYRGINNRTLAHKKKDITTLTSSATNTNINANTGVISIAGSAVGGNINGLDRVWVYEHNGIGEEDDKLVHIYVDALVSDNGTNVDLNLNGSPYVTQNIIPANHITNARIYNINLILTSLILSTVSLNFELSLSNTIGYLSKIGFGLTGGTYASPTGTNGTFGGDATNGSTLTDTPSLLSLTIQ